jgi:trehalose-6-phosphate synthase
VIAAVDYMHPISGITNKFRAFYEFLKDNRKQVENLIFVQYLVPIKGIDDSL